MVIYLDSEYRSHVDNDGTMTPAETNFFDGKCKAFIEGYRYIPTGKSWVSENGDVFYGEMFSPFEDADIFTKAQEQHEIDEFKRLSDLGISIEESFIATRNYPVGSFLSVYAQLYEVISAIPANTSIVVGQNVYPTTIGHYLDTLKETNS